MAAAPISWAGLLVILGLSGGMGLPLGVPPTEEDAAIARAAPDECLFYTAWSGMAQPDPESANQTEQLLAEPEVQRFIQGVEQAVVTALKERAAGEGPQPEELMGDLIDWVRQVVTRPGAVFVSSVSIEPSGPDVRGGAVVNLGESAERVKASLEKHQRMFLADAAEQVDIGGTPCYRLTLEQGAPQITWCMKSTYLLVGVGAGSMEGLLDRLRSDPPDWLAEAHRQLPLARRSTLTFVNLDSVREILAPRGGPQVMAVINAVGLGNVSALASTTGLDDDGFVSRVLLQFEGELTGLMSLVDVPPLTEGDLEGIPRDATIAVAARADAGRMFEQFASVVGTIEPRARGEMERAMAEITREIGIDVRTDVLEPLGDVWRLYNSPSEGGLVVSGLTAVIDVADPEKMKATDQKFRAALERAMPQRAEPMRGPEIKHFEFAGQDVYMLNTREEQFPLAPSWCLAGDKLIVSLFPQNVKAYLSRGDDFQSLASIEEVAAALSADPMKLVYVDTLAVFKLAYPVVQFGAQMAASGMRREGIDVSVSLLPSAAAIAGHLRPAVVAVRRSEAGMEIIGRQSLPGGGLGSALPLMMGVTIPRAVGPGMAAARVQSVNNMKQIMLALHNYHDVYKRFPPAYTTDDQGGPLLSWRVQILPYLDQQALYEQFHLDEPWDSEHNKRLLAQMPEVYRSPKGSREPGKTNYLGVANENGLFPGESPISIAQIRDGTSNTIGIVEADNASAVLWTSPNDYHPQPGCPAAALIATWPDGFLAGFTDGSVQQLSADLDADLLMRLFQRDDGEPIRRDEPGGEQTRGPFGGLALAAVSGTVTVDGEPLAGARVVFDPEEGRPSAGLTDASGRFQLKYTFDRNGAEVGRHMVRIVAAQGGRARSVELPPKYNQQSELMAEIQQGENVFDFNLISE